MMKCPCKETIVSSRYDDKGLVSSIKTPAIQGEKE